MLSAAELSKREPEEIEHEIEGTRAALGEKIGALEQEVLGTVEGAKQTVQETVEEVKKTFDVRERVRERPFACVGGAFAVGALVGFILLTPERRGREARGEDFDPPPARPFGPQARGILGSIVNGIVLNLAREAAAKIVTAASARPAPHQPPAEAEWPDADTFRRT